MNESFWTLMRSAGHWEFEIFLMVVFDGLILGAVWPFLRKHYLHHVARDRRDMLYRHDWSMNPIARSSGHIPEYRPYWYDDSERAPLIGNKNSENL